MLSHPVKIMQTVIATKILPITSSLIKIFTIFTITKVFVYSLNFFAVCYGFPAYH